MKKNNLLWIAAAIFLLPCKYACNNKSDTLGKAKLVFEQEYEKIQNILDSVSRLDAYDSIRWITEMEEDTYLGPKLNNLKLTPQWNRAELSSFFVFVPITPDHKFRAGLFKKEEDISTTWEVPVLQKLAVKTKSPMQCYIASYIPTPEYFESFNFENDEDFGDLEQVNNFSGGILYCDLQNGKTVRIEKYIDGKLVQSLDNSGDDKTFGKEVSKIFDGEILLITRSMTEADLQETMKRMQYH